MLFKFYSHLLLNKSTMGLTLLTQSKMAIHRAKDFQGAPGVEIFNKFVKLGDCLILATLLLKHSMIQRKIKESESLDVHDVGGADGEMMFTLLRILNFRANVTVNEPNQQRLELYQKKQKQHPTLFSSIVGDRSKIEDKHFTISSKKELILASHVLYYNRSQWLTCEILSEHLLSKLFRSLCPGGVLCVTLQYSALEELCQHALWEDFIYPLLDGIKHGENVSFASSDLFETALDAYRKQFIYETGQAIDWIIHTDIAKTSVPLGVINTIPDLYGKYSQPEEVLKIINFYLKYRRFEDLSADLQKRVLDIILRHFEKNGRYEIVHYNKIYTIEIGEALFTQLNTKQHEKIGVPTSAAM